MLRVCKPGGKILVSVWALEQEKDSRFKFQLGNNLVKWKDTTAQACLPGKKRDSLWRYYYIYDKNTITDFLKNYIVEKLFLDMGNWFFILVKDNV